MDARKLQAHEKSLTAINVCVSFTVKVQHFAGGNHSAENHVRWAYNRTCNLYPILLCVVRKNEQNCDYFEMNPGGQSSVERLVSFTKQSCEIPPKDTIQAQLTDEARRPTDISKGLFSLKVVQYIDGLVFHLIISHAITDGTSIFGIVDTICHYLSDAANNSADYFSVSHNRDLVGELLADPRCTEAPDSRFAEDSSTMMKLPKLTETNCDKDNNGCMRVLFYELDPETTAAILKNCRKHKVSFQALISAASSLALLKALNSANELDESKWNSSVFQFCPANMRRFLLASSESPADRISANCSGGVWWKQAPFKSYDTLSNRLFWSDLVLQDTYQQMLACLGSSYPLQQMHRGETGETYNPYTMAACSIGNITCVKQQYGTDLVVQDVTMQVGIYASSEEAYQNPVVPEVVLSNEVPAHLMLHAYTVFGRLKVSGEYYAYSNEYAALFYDEIVRILIESGSDRCGEEVRVGDLFALN